jgi:hypothetical protein
MKVLAAEYAVQCEGRVVKKGKTDTQRRGLTGMMT